MRIRPDSRLELRTLGGALILGFGIIASLVFVNYFARDFSIWVLGRRAIAEVVAQWYEVADEKNQEEPLFQYYIRYRFTASNGQILERDHRVGAMEWGAMPIGSSVIVGYFPLYPQHNRLDNARYIPLYACTYVPLAFLSVAALVYGWSLVRADPDGLLPKLVAGDGGIKGDQI